MLYKCLHYVLAYISYEVGEENRRHSCANTSNDKKKKNKTNKTFVLNSQESLIHVILKKIVNVFFEELRAVSNRC